MSLLSVTALTGGFCLGVPPGDMGDGGSRLPSASTALLSLPRVIAPSQALFKGPVSFFTFVSMIMFCISSVKSCITCSEGGLGYGFIWVKLVWEVDGGWIECNSVCSIIDACEQKNR